MYEHVFKLQSKLFKALAHPRRLEIIQLLQGQKLSVSEIYQMLDLPQANVSQHLMVLRDTQILHTKKNGKQIYYQISDPLILKAVETIRSLTIKQHKNSSVTDELTLNMEQLVPVVHDPVCQMRVSPKTASYAIKHKGQTYYFCASGCYKKFKDNPKKYVT